MKHTKILAILPVAILVIAIGMYAPNNAYASGRTATPLPAPTGLTCSQDGGNLVVTWNSVLGASKYAVEYTTTYSSDPSQKFSTGSVTSPLTTLLSSLDSTPTAQPPLTVDVAVKALNPPGKSQNNPFATASCTLSET